MKTALVCPPGVAEAVQAIPHEVRGMTNKGLDRLMAAGLCRAESADPERWFPLAAEAPVLGPVEVADLRSDADRACRGCPARSACLEKALRCGPEFGLWGGLAPMDRAIARHMRRQLDPAESGDIRDPITVGDISQSAGCAPQDRPAEAAA